MKARNYAAYSPAYSPAMSGQTSKVNLDAGSAGSYHLSHGVGSSSVAGSELPMQSPLYQPPSMGGMLGQ